MKKCGSAGQATVDSMIRYVRFACWITKDTDTHTHTHRICNTYGFTTATMVARTLLNVAFYEHCLSGSYFAVFCFTITKFRFTLFNNDNNNI